MTGTISNPSNSQMNDDSKAIQGLEVVLQHSLMKCDLGFSLDFFEAIALELKEFLIADKFKGFHGPTEQQKEHEKSTDLHLYETSLGFLDHGYLHYLQVRFEKFFGREISTMPSNNSVSDLFPSIMTIYTHSFMCCS